MTEGEIGYKLLCLSKTGASRPPEYHQALADVARALNLPGLAARLDARAGGQAEKPARPRRSWLTCARSWLPGCWPGPRTRNSRRVWGAWRGNLAG